MSSILPRPSLGDRVTYELVRKGEVVRLTGTLVRTDRTSKWGHRYYVALPGAADGDKPARVWAHMIVAVEPPGSDGDGLPDAWTTVDEVAADYAISKPVVYLLLSTLARRGVIERRRVPGGRRQLAYLLTAEARRQLREKRSNAEHLAAKRARRAGVTA